MNAITRIEDMGFRDVAYQMTDCHADYYDVAGGEVKITHEDDRPHFKPEGHEDWQCV